MEQSWYVCNCDLFERLSCEEIRRLEYRSWVRSYARGTEIELPSEATTSVFTLTAGQVQIKRTYTDRRPVERISLDPGDLFGPLPRASQQSFTEVLEVREASTLLRMPPEVSQDLLRTQPRVTMESMRWLGLRRDRTDRRLVDLLFLSSRDKLALWLLRMAAHHASPFGDGLRFDVDLSLRDFAIALGSFQLDVERAWLDLLMKRELRYELGKPLIVNRTRFENLVVRNNSARPQYWQSFRRVAS